MKKIIDKLHTGITGIFINIVLFITHIFFSFACFFVYIYEKYGVGWYFDFFYGKSRVHGNFKNKHQLYWNLSHNYSIKPILAILIVLLMTTIAALDINNEIKLKKKKLWKIFLYLVLLVISIVFVCFVFYYNAWWWEGESV